MIGIDISHWDKKKVDFREILGSQDFVIIKATDGTRIDPEFTTNYNALKRLKIGLYAYTYATTPEAAKREAAAFCTAVKALQHDMGCFIDVEDKTLKKLTKQQLTDILNAWAVTAKSFGIDIGIYTNPDWIEHRLDLESLQITKLWLAVWTSDLSKLIKYRAKYRPDIIQWTDSFKLSNGKKVDGDVVF